MRADRDALLGYDFPLDPFQLEALDVLDDGSSVLVAAPTGSGKTVVAEYAVACALADGVKLFYTAPIKALSNQKYRDLCARHGSERVGLLTGDNNINGDADIVVMTTEVLRNMLYANSRALDRLAFVVLDEVHYLQDTYRGPVWEEVIIHLPGSVALVCLSATVSNADELAEWIDVVHGPTECIVERERPVRLVQHYLVGDRSASRPRLLPILVRNQPNPEAYDLDAPPRAPSRREPERRPRRPLFTPSRVETVARLAQEQMLPAICFIFSRKQCDEAARSCLAAGLVLTDDDQRARIRHVVERRLALLDPSTLEALDYEAFLESAEAGFTAHHAGMVPAFKETVEELFTAGLVRVVFATETLAVGINMPARTVVIERLTKFTGDHHEFLTPGEFTQLTGRAGRRGIDDLGHAVVLWSPFVAFEQIVELATSTDYVLRSAFKPTYNMAANLVRNYDHAEAHRLLGNSFAQFQADRSVVRLQRRLATKERQLDEARADATSPFGDVFDFLAAKESPPVPVRRGPDAAVTRSLGLLRPGDVVVLPAPHEAGRVVVITSTQRRGSPRLQVLTERRQALTITDDDVARPLRALARIELPTPFAPDRDSFRRHAARRLRDVDLGDAGPGRGLAGATERRPSHPVEADPDLDDRITAARKARRLEREIERLRASIEASAGTLTVAFDRVLGLLAELGYVEGWRLTQAGEALARTFHECDLLVVECVRAGVLDGLAPAELAAMVSCFTYEHRSPEPPPEPWFPRAELAKRWRRIVAISQQLERAETAAGLVPQRAPDATFAAVAHGWAAGTGYADMAETESLSGGDFVRNIRQLIDLLRQLAVTAADPALRSSAGTAADALFRGVVSDGSVVANEDDT